MKTIWLGVLVVMMIIQGIIVLIAEHQENYIKASYEMLWFFFFNYLIHLEKEKEVVK